MEDVVEDMDVECEEFVDAAKQASDMENKIRDMYNTSEELWLDGDKECWGELDYGFSEHYCGPDNADGWHYLAYVIRKLFCLYGLHSIEDLCEKNDTTVNIIAKKFGKYIPLYFVD